MNCKILIIVAMIANSLSTIAWAQMQPPTLNVAVIGDRANVFQQSGSDIEVFPTKRVGLVTSAAGSGQIAAVKTYAAATPYSPALRGVVFNYSLQQYGLTTGEIAFMLKPGASLSGAELGSKMRPAKIMKSGVYVVTANTPQSFLETVRALQNNSSVSWVEPTINYGPVQKSPSVQ